jgi:hypothetical protein
MRGMELCQPALEFDVRNGAICICVEGLVDRVFGHLCPCPSHHDRRAVAREIIGQKPERHGCQPRAEKRHDLREEQVAICAVGEDFQLCRPQR